MLEPDRKKAPACTPTPRTPAQASWRVVASALAVTAAVGSICLPMIGTAVWFFLAFVLEAAGIGGFSINADSPAAIMLRLAGTMIALALACRGLVKLYRRALETEMALSGRYPAAGDPHEGEAERRPPPPRRGNSD